MGRIVAIGGGEIGRPSETIEIDREIVRSGGRKNPGLLFLPTASEDSQAYSGMIKEHFGRKLGCDVDVLNLIGREVSYEEMREKVLSSDIIYVGGGDTSRMMEVWQEKGLGSILREAWKSDVVLSGISAGSMCWFDNGLSFSSELEQGRYSMIKLEGLGFVSGINVPHYDVEPGRREGLRKVLGESEVALALENCTAFEVVGDKYRFLSSKKDAHGYLVYWQSGEFRERALEKDGVFRPLSEIYMGSF